MSFKGLAFIRQGAKEHIYKLRVLGEPQRSAPALAETLRKDASATQVELEEVEEEVGPLEKGIGKMMDGPRYAEMMGTSIRGTGYQRPPTRRG